MRALHVVVCGASYSNSSTQSRRCLYLSVFRHLTFVMYCITGRSWSPVSAEEESSYRTQATEGRKQRPCPVSIYTAYQSINQFI